MKRFFALILCLCMVLAGCGGAATAETTEAPTTETTQPPISIEEYSQMVSDSAAKIEKAALGVGNLALYQVKFMTNLSKISGNTNVPDDLLEKSLAWIEKNSDYTKDSMDADFKENSADYKAIMTVKAPEEAAKIEELYDSYFTAYLNLYNLAMHPSSADALATDGNEYITTISTVKPKLDVLLSE
jgi:hypothetical protein